MLRCNDEGIDIGAYAQTIRNEHPDGMTSFSPGFDTPRAKLPNVNNRPPPFSYVEGGRPLALPARRMNSSTIFWRCASTEFLRQVSLQQSACSRREIPVLNAFGTLEVVLLLQRSDEFVIEFEVTLCGLGVRYGARDAPLALLLDFHWGVVRRLKRRSKRR